MNPGIKHGQKKEQLVCAFFAQGQQGQIHGNPVADGWAEAVEQKPLAIQKCYGPTDQRTDRPMDQHGKVQSPQLDIGREYKRILFHFS